jgi:Fe(3+) dicitrate transport protein
VTREHVLVFGLGATYQLDQHWTLFGGMHEGFNPPGPGSTSGAEESVNSEFGVRYRSADWFGEAVLFHSDYANLVGTCTASTGGSCVIGDQFDAGRARVQGLELSAERRFMLPGEMSLALPFEFNYTYTDTKFEEAFASGFGPWGNVAVGDEFPYVPEHSLQVRAGLEAADWSVGLSATLNDGVRTAAGQGPLVAGQRTDTALLWDLSARYSLTADSELFFAIENLTDQTYLAATRPAGSRPGLPRTFRLGFSIAW